ncbi:MAG TPA: hypothetical protein VL354_12715 [Spirochaetia bacterium]|nr:hypothetical protein [Spirochaetia bacterium]
MKRIAVATWQGRVGTTLDFAVHLLLVDVEGCKTGRRKEISLKGNSPQETALILEQFGVTDVICGAISSLLSQRLEMGGMRVIPFVSGEVEEVLHAFINDGLGDRKFLMAGCPPGARRAWRCRRKRGQTRRTQKP